MHQSQIMIERLAKTNARIKPDTAGIDTARHGNISALGEEIAHFADDILIARCGLHRRGCARHMHENDRDTEFGCGLDSAFGTQRHDVIPDISARPDRGAGDFRFAGVDRDSGGRLLAQGLDDRDDAAHLLSGIDRRRTRPRRLATDIDDIGTIAEHFQPARDRSFLVDEITTIGKTVRRDVENAHDEGDAGLAAGSSLAHPFLLVCPPWIGKLRR